MREVGTPVAHVVIAARIRPRQHVMPAEELMIDAAHSVGIARRTVSPLAGDVGASPKKIALPELQRPDARTGCRCSDDRRKLIACLDEQRDGARPVRDDRDTRIGEEGLGAQNTLRLRAFSLDARSTWLHDQEPSNDTGLRGY